MGSVIDIAVTLFLLGIVILLGLLLYTVLFHAWWRVPYVPTPMSIVRVMVQVANLKPGDTVMDLGAGDGRLLRTAKKAEPGITAIGYEGAFFVWWWGKLKNVLSGRTDIRWYRKNFLVEDLSEADVIFTYLTMDTMKKLLGKFRRELRPGTRIVTHAFRLPDIEPTEKQQVKGIVGGKSNVYLYVWK